jgi:predicted  nucleic acid-binding Zn-ribbon protein
MRTCRTCGNEFKTGKGSYKDQCRKCYGREYHAKLIQARAQLRAQEALQRAKENFCEPEVST